MSVFREQDTQEAERLVQHKSPDSPEPSCVSMKSDWSMDRPIGFKSDTSSTKFRPVQRKSPDSPEPSCVSMKSDWSMDRPIGFKSDTSSTKFRPVQHKSPDSPEPSCVSMKSDWSMDRPIGFKSDTSSTKFRCHTKTSESSCKNMESILEELEHKVISLVKNQLKRFMKILSLDYSECSKERKEHEKDQSVIGEGALKITLHVLKNMNQTDLANTLLTKLGPPCHLKHKSTLSEKFLRINLGVSNPGSSVLLNEIYTELYITEGGSGEVNNEHEVRQIEAASRRLASQEIPIRCNKLFEDQSIRTVLTKGVAGIGKTVSVQKFILDWAEGKNNQDILFIFPLPFRELNLMKEKKLSLEDLLHCFFADTKELNPRDYHHNKVMFIFDGLDECHLPLDFQNNKNLSDITQPASVDVLLTNLIRGNLLPSALLWITTRPAAANQIPPCCITQVTEVRGFSDPQKKEYFRKRIRKQSLAERIITHMKSSRSLYIMCHIPVFCWISATVLERLLGDAEGGEIPKTLTQMFTYFLIFQIKHRSQKYHQNSDVDLKKTREIVLALGKLAFQQLQKGNLIFYEEDLKDCGIDVREVSVYSGVCTQIFREESGLYLGRVFSFVHLSVQEFLAALFAFLSFIYYNRNVLQQDTGFSCSVKMPTMSMFLKAAVDEALQSVNGQLDLFLRFLLGLSVESNQTLLQGLLTQTGNSSHSKEEVVEYIKQRIRVNPSPEKTISLFHCLNELNDHSLVQEVQKYLKVGDSSDITGVKLSSAQWSAVAFVMLNSEEELDFDLSKYDKSEDCLLRLLPVAKASKKVLLPDCKIEEEGCAALICALKSNPSHLRELNMHNNRPGVPGVKQLSALLEDPQCKVEKLQLSGCSIADKGWTVLVSALMSNPSHLRKLNLSCNELGKSGVNLLSELLKDPQCNLENLQLWNCGITEKGCAALAAALKTNPSHLKALNLSWNKPEETGVKLLSDLLQDPRCELEILQLELCGVTEKGCAALCSALKSNPSHLRKLNLNFNKLGKSGKQTLFKLLEDPHYKLESLEACDCSEQIKLNLNGQRLGESGARLLTDLLRDPHCQLEELQLYECNIPKESRAALVSAISSNSSNLRVLNLRHYPLQDSEMKLLSNALKWSHCKLEKIRLLGCNITPTGCAALISALKSNHSCLKILSLSGNDLCDSGMKLLSEVLLDPRCKLEELLLTDCSLTEKSCAALSLNSGLRELRLSDNKLQDSGVILLSDGLKNPHCKLEKLVMWSCDLSEKSCAALASALSSNSSTLRELYLSYNNLRDSGVKLLSVGLENPHCKLEILHLIRCGISDEGCAALASALRLNPSYLKELNLNCNKIGKCAVELLSDILEDPHCKLEKLYIWMQNT